MKRIEDIKEFEDIDTYYGVLELVEEVFQDRVETHKHLVTATEEIERQKEIIKQLDIKNLELTTIIKEVREYIKNNYPVCAGADLLKILSGEDNE